MSTNLLLWLVCGALLGRLLVGTAVDAQNAILIFGSSSNAPQVITTDGSNALNVIDP